MHSLFEQQSKLTPKCIAVCDESSCLTYAELDQRANQVAHLLLANGVQIGDLVGLALNRDVELLVGLLGILKAGAAYLPLESDTPIERQQFQCEDAGIEKMLIQHTNDERQILTPHSIQMKEALRYGKEPPTLARPLNANDLAYTLYTSGSTGKPKGVDICHAGLTNVIDYRLNHLLTSAERATIPLTAALSFDASVAQIFTPICCGGTCVITDNVLSLMRSTHRDTLTCMSATPSLARYLITADMLPARLNALILCGESLDDGLCQQIFDKTGIVKLINLYGPTETTIHSTCEIIFDKNKSPKIALPVSIGFPISNTTVHILNDKLETCDIDEPGTIYIAGMGLAKGYRNRDVLTRQQFLSVKIAGVEQRVYDTGDIGSITNDGKIRFIGRNDRQIQIRGERIELDEVEKTLNSCSLVENCVVAYNTTAEQPCIEAFITLTNRHHTSHARSLTNIRQYMKAQLPMNMLPQTYSVLDTMPLTQSGKIDRKALTN